MVADSKYKEEWKVGNHTAQECESFVDCIIFQIFALCVLMVLWGSVLRLQHHLAGSIYVEFVLC